jgi:2-methylcitrate dehydratase PrpD
VPLIVGIDDFAALVTDPAVRDLAARTHCVFDAEIDVAMTREVVPARVTVTLHDGTTREQRVMLPKGCPDNPITPAEVRDRFRLMAAAKRSPVEIEAWLDKSQKIHLLPLAADLMT